LREFVLNARTDGGRVDGPPDAPPCGRASLSEASGIFQMAKVTRDSNRWSLDDIADWHSVVAVD